MVVSRPGEVVEDAVSPGIGRTSRLGRREDLEGASDYLPPGRERQGILKSTSECARVDLARHTAPPVVPGLLANGVDRHPDSLGREDEGNLERERVPPLDEGAHLPDPARQAQAHGAKFLS